MDEVSAVVIGYFMNLAGNFVLTSPLVDILHYIII